VDGDSVNGAGADAPARRFDAVAVLGVIDDALSPRDRTIAGDDHVDALGDSGPLDVAATIAWAQRHRPRNGPVLVLTDRDLSIPEVGSLFGFSDRRRGVAIVSSFRLAATDAVQSRRRIANAIAHEAGHLDGLRHCSNDCVMRQAMHAADLDTRPGVPCGRCPRRTNVVTATVVALAVTLLIIGIASRLIEYRVPQRVTPDLPRVVSDALADLPRDPDEVFSRPVIVVARTVLGNAPVLLTPAVLPPGLDAAMLKGFAESITSATFRTPEAMPIAHVHVIQTRGSALDLTDALGCPRPGGHDAYTTCRIERNGIETHVVTPRQGTRTALVFSPSPNGREMAARLAGQIGTGAGVWRDRDMNALIGTLPAVLPNGFALETLVASNVHRVPESVDELSTVILGEEFAGSADELKHVMPLAIQSATYRNGQGDDITVIVGDYGSRPTAWFTYRSIRRLLEPWTTGTIDVNGTEAHQLAGGSRHGVIFRQGPLLVAVHSRAHTSAALVREMAGALQP
jgi:hypothetical protein